MTKADLVAVVSRQTGIVREDVEKVVNETFEQIMDSVKDGDGFYCRGFGSFTRKTRAQKIGRNISKGTAIVIPEHNVPIFKPYSEFKAGV
jgi:DNA-binding protein HU-beta